MLFLKSNFKELRKILRTWFREVCFCRSSWPSAFRQVIYHLSFFVCSHLLRITTRQSRLDSKYSALTSVVSEPLNSHAATFNSCTYQHSSFILSVANMAAREHESPCYFDTLSKCFPHILENIFFSLDYESFKNCLEVSNGWKCVLTSMRYQTVGKSVFKREILKDGAKLQ